MYYNNKMKIKSGNYIVKLAAAIMLLSFCWIILSGNTFNPDTISYVRMYEGTSGKHEIGFMFLCDLIYSLGRTYQEFRIIVYSIILFLLFIFAKRVKANCFWVFLLYLIYPLFLDGIQIRSALSYAIALVGVTLLYSNSKYNILKFILVIFLAGTIHYMALFYLVFIFSKLGINKKTFLKIVSMLTVILLVMLYLYPKSIVELIAFSSNKVKGNFIHHARIGIIVSIALHLGGFYLYRKEYIRQMNTGKWDSKYDIHYKINILMLLLVPFYAFSMNFFRIYRLMIFSNNAFIFNESIGQRKFTCSKVQLEAVLYVILLGIQQIYWSGLQKGFFDNNILFARFL